MPEMAGISMNHIQEEFRMAFKDRIVQYPNRYTLTKDDGTVLGTFTLTRAEGEVTEEGTLLNADGMTENVQEMIDASMDGISIDSNQNVRFRNLQRGRAKITGKAKKVVSKTITFSKVFSVTPRVVITPITENPQNISVGISNVSTTGFTINLYRTTNATNNIDWMAMA